MRQAKERKLSTNMESKKMERDRKGKDVYCACHKCWATKWDLKLPLLFSILQGYGKRKPLDTKGASWTSFQTFSSSSSLISPEFSKKQFSQLKRLRNLLFCIMRDEKKLHERLKNIFIIIDIFFPFLFTFLILFFIHCNICLNRPWTNAGDSKLNQ